MDRRDRLAKMNRALKTAELTDSVEPSQRDKLKRDLRNLPAIDIAPIGAVAFHRQMMKKDSEIFVHQSARD
jgi:hypothetical protein